MTDHPPYSFKKEDREILMGTVGFKDRKTIMKILDHHYEHRHVGHLIEVFADFILMANSVIENNRAMIEDYMIAFLDHHPHTAEKINLPTMFGALNGLALAVGVAQERTCTGCAFRVGTPANQSPVTTCDAEHQQHNNDMFFCHYDLDEMNMPTRKCTGFLQKRKIENGR